MLAHTMAKLHEYCRPLVILVVREGIVLYHHDDAC